MPNTSGAVDLSLKDLNEEERAAVKKLAEETGGETPADTDEETVTPNCYTGFTLLLTGNEPFEVAILPGSLPEGIVPEKEVEASDIYNTLQIALENMKINRIVQTVMQAQQMQLQQLQQQQQAAALQKKIEQKGGYRAKR